MLKAFDGGRLFGASFGSDKPWALALHGWARTHQDFSEVLGPRQAASPVRGPRPTGGGPSGGADGTTPEGAASALDLDAVALDLPGFGATPPPPAPWGSEDYATAVAPVLTEIETPVVLVGHSFGGRVAVHLAAALPDKVKALVLTGAPLRRPPGGGRKPALRYRIGRTLAAGGLLSEARMENLRQRYGSPDYRAAQGVMRQVFVRVVNESYDEQLRAVRCPVELVWADDDTEAPLSVAEWAADLLTSSNLTVCTGAGHLLPLTAPEALRRAIERHRP